MRWFGCVKEQGWWMKIELPGRRKSERPQGRLMDVVMKEMQRVGVTE